MATQSPSIDRPQPDPSQPDPSPLTVLVQDDDGGRPTPLPVSPGLAEAIGRAAIVNEGQDPMALSFSSLFIGLLAGDDAVGEWLRDEEHWSRAGRDALLERRGISARRFEELRAQPPRPTTTPFTRSVSARSALDEAARLARDLESAVIETRHVLAVYLALPAYHENDFRALVIDRVAWAAAFSRAMAERYAEEAAFWNDFYARVFPARADDIDLSGAGLEAHVVTALGVAARLAGDGSIEPHHVVTAILDLAGDANSDAFRRLAQLVPLPLSVPKTKATATAPPDPTQLGEALRRQIAWAQRPSEHSKRSTRLWGRDLATAALLCDDSELPALVARAGRSLREVRNLWYAFVTRDNSRRTPEQWRAWWLQAGVALPEPVRPGMATETDVGDDKLGISPEAGAFARLIMDRDVKPPLSIGLLGDWGSGKSFFIEQIKKQIAELKRSPRAELHAHVVEIEFNAWHASDSNLWASLVTYIFDEIWAQVSAEGNLSPADARAELTRQIEQAGGAVHEAEVQLQLARDALAAAERELTSKREKLAVRAYVKRAALQKLAKLAEATGFRQPLQTINDVDTALHELAQSGSRLRLIGGAFLEKPLLHVALPVALMSAATAAAWVALQHANLDGLPQWIIAATGALAALVAPLQAASRTVAQLADTLGSVKGEYEAEVDKVAKDHPELGRDLVSARRELTSAEASVDAAKTRLAELLNQRAALDPLRRLGSFLQERVQSTLYRSQQGIISLVHKDFRELSRYMEDLRSARDRGPSGRGGSTAPGIKPFDRIVIYVDDLDRCRPDQVVHMLEAVHLLLALDLFVVVVAVDSRWLTRALEVHYKELLTNSDGRERAATPLSYLEKIFQITYALGPMDPVRFKDYVATLAGHEGGAGRDADGEGGSGASQRSAGQPERSGNGAGAAGGDGSGSTDGSGATTRSNGAGKAAKASTVRQAVRLDTDEQKLITALVPLLPTPRTAKRLVNVYRLIKASKSIEELEAFEAQGRPRSCLLMLALLFGRPELAAELLRALHERTAPFGDPKALLSAAVRKRAAQDMSPHARAEWMALRDALERMKIDVTVEQCAREPIEVARYSLVTGNDWHTWIGNRTAP